MRLQSAISMAISVLRRCRRSFTSSAVTSDWIGRGLSFKCTQCGKCCTGGRERVVWVSDQEANVIAGSLGLDGEEFADQYLQASAGPVASAGSRLSLRKNSTDTACVFLKDGKCSVYLHRPTQVRRTLFCNSYNTGPSACDLNRFSGSPTNSMQQQPHVRRKTTLQEEADLIQLPLQADLDTAALDMLHVRVWLEECRTYPFWPEPLTSRHDWEAEALRCEGIRLQSSALPRHHRHSHSGTDHTLHSELPVAAESQQQEDSIQPSSSKVSDQDEGMSVSTSGSEAGTSDATVLVETIKKQLVLEEISRSGEMGGSTYDEMDELLTDVSPELVEEFSRDFFDNRGRKILHDSRRWRVLDTWIGDPAQYFRSLVLKACPGYAQTEVQTTHEVDGSMRVQHDKLCQPAHKALCLAFALQALSQKHMHMHMHTAAAASPLHRPITVHHAPALQPSSELGIAVIGAGGCALPMAIHRHFPQATVDAVDIDAEALDLAQCYFGAEEDAHLLMHHDDGVKFLTRCGVASKFDIIMLDVAAPDPTADPGTLNSIPAQFLSAGFVLEGLQRRLWPGGVAAINILGGMPALKQAAAALSPHFQHLHALRTPEAAILFGRAALGSHTGSASARTALWRVTAAAAAIKPLTALCDELLSEQLELWAMNDALHDMLKSEFGYGWFSGQEILTV